MEGKPKQKTTTETGMEGKRKETIKYKEIEELREPLKNILKEMREHIDRGEYGLIIGDDASGRIPTWFFYNFLKELYTEKNLPSPEVRYFAGSGGFLIDQLEDKVKKLERYAKQAIEKRNLKNPLAEYHKALIITDTINSGNSLRPLFEALKAQDIPFDVAAIGFHAVNLNERAAELKHEFKMDIFYGSTQTPSIYQRPDFSGIEKDSKNIFSQRYNRASPSVVAQARVNAKMLAHELVEWYVRSKTEDAKH